MRIFQNICSVEPGSRRIIEGFCPAAQPCDVGASQRDMPIDPPRPSQHRHHRPRRPRQDHAGRQAAACRPGTFAAPSADRRADDGQQRHRARARHHDPRQELRDRLRRRRHADQHRRHARARRLRRRGRARARHGRRRAAAGRRGRRPDAADALRHAEGAGAGPEADRRRQQGRPPRRARRSGSSTRRSSCSTSSARPTSSSTSRSSTRRRCKAGRRSTSTVAKSGASQPETASMQPLFEAILEHVPAPQGDADGAAAVPGQRARLLELSRPPRHRPHPPRHAWRPGQDVAVLHGPLAEGAGADAGEDRPGASGSRASSARRSKRATAGDIVLVTGIDDLSIGTTLAVRRCARGAAADHGRRADARR